MIFKKVLLASAVIGGSLLFVAGAAFIIDEMRYASNSIPFNLFVAAKCKCLKYSAKGHSGHLGHFPGSEGWRFLRTNLGCIMTPWALAHRNMETIVAMHDSLKKIGIELIVVPVPDKEMIIQKYSPFTVTVASNQRARFIAGLLENHVNAIDLVHPYMKENEKDSLYLKMDTHWASKGIMVAAEIISAQVNRILHCEGMQRHYCLKDTAITAYEDCALPEDSPMVQRGCIMVFNKDGSPYRDSLKSDIMIFGDSFAEKDHGYSAGIGDHIAYCLNQPTFTIYHIGASFQGPRMLHDFLKNRKHLPRVIVWVFVSRYLPLQFEAF